MDAHSSKKGINDPRAFYLVDFVIPWDKAIIVSVSMIIISYTDYILVKTQISLNLLDSKSVEPPHWLKFSTNLSS